MDENVVVIGAGQAGLATSYHLRQLGIDHQVLEAGRVGETWRSRRWDSFCLVTPNWSVQLPGGVYGGSEPDGFMSKPELIAHFDRWAESFDAPVRERCSVAALDSDGNGFALTTSDGQIKARTVVIATGGYQRAYLPPAADQLPDSVDQLLTEGYSCPDALAPGNVLIVGSGQSGCQIAEELHEDGRKVFLACGRAPWAPRRLAGHDLIWWMVESGWWSRPPSALPSPEARLFSNPLATGHGGGRDMHLRTLHAAGIELVGRYLGTDDSVGNFADDVNQNVDAGDNMSRALKKYIDAAAAEMGMPSPWEMPEPFRIQTRTKLDLAAEGITTVIWTTGYRPDYGWVRFPLFDEMGFPIQVDGRTEVPGLYFMGVHFQRKAQSAVLYGVGEDAEMVASHIAQNRR